MNKKQKEVYRIHQRIVDAAQQGNMNETMTLLHTIQTDFPGELYRGFDLFFWNHLVIPIAPLIGASPDARPNDRYQYAQYTALSVAAQGRHIALVKAILAPGLDPTSKSMFVFGLKGAIFGGDVAVVEVLLDYGVDINTHYPRLMTALELSVLKSDNTMIAFLLAHGAVCTPFALVLAAMSGKVEMLRLLLAQGCDVNAPANMNALPFHRSRYRTPLEVAREECPPPCRNTVVQMLLDAGARS